jgi:YgiT-type zinc finger domain-containing protein
MKMKCPICAKAELVRDTRDISYTYKGETTVFTGTTGDFCPACGESIYDAEESTRVSALMLEFNKQVNAAKALPFELLTPNATTVAAMCEARAGNLDRFDSVDALMNDLHAKN